MSAATGSGTAVAAPVGRWRLVVPVARLQALEGNRDFQSCLVLARIANALKAGRQAMAAAPELAPTPAGDRQVLAGVLHVGALLFEGLGRLEKIGRYLKALPDVVARIEALSGDPDLTELRATVLKRLRNKVAFHFDEDAVRDGLRSFGSEEIAFSAERPDAVVFATGHSDCEGHLAYVLADDIVLRYLVGGSGALRQPLACGLAALCSQVLG